MCDDESRVSILRRTAHIYHLTCTNVSDVQGVLIDEPLVPNWLPSGTVMLRCPKYVPLLDSSGTSLVDFYGGSCLQQKKNLNRRRRQQRGVQSVLSRICVKVMFSRLGLLLFAIVVYVQFLSVRYFLCPGLSSGNTGGTSSLSQYQESPIAASLGRLCFSEDGIHEEKWRGLLSHRIQGWIPGGKCCHLTVQSPP